MNSLIAWTALVLVVVILTLVAHFFSLRTLRAFAGIVTLATAAYMTWYGLEHPARATGSLTDAFTRGADMLSIAFIRLLLAPGHHVPEPGRIGWIVIVALLVLGYRELEVWALHGQARSLDTSALGEDRQDNASGDDKGALTDKQRHDRLAAELKFRLPAVQVRSPAIYPGGSRSGGLASIAEASGITGGGLAAAIIRFFGMLWPNPRRVQIRVWVERTRGQTGLDGLTRVTVDLGDPRTGLCVATKTMAASNLDDAASVVAGYVAQYIFAADPTAPPWCTGAADGRDLGALLLARQVRIYPESEHEVDRARGTQIQILENVAGSSLCAGVVRYELAQLYDLAGRHVDALLLHAINRERYPRFYRGRYRLAMSMKMIAHPSHGKELGPAEIARLGLAMKILYGCGAVKADKSEDILACKGRGDLPAWLRGYLLDAACRELRAIRRYLLLWHIVWQSFWHRDERGILKPYFRLRHRQAFHDGIFIALLDVAVRQALLEGEPGYDSSPGAARRVPHRRELMRIATAVAGDSSAVAAVMKAPAANLGEMSLRAPPMVDRLRTRLWLWQCRTRSWQAAYNLACAYAAIADDRMRKIPDAGETEVKRLEGEVAGLVGKVVASLEFAICNPECEMERPWEWIAHDPDFAGLRDADDDPTAGFRDFLKAQKLRDYPPPPVDEALERLRRGLPGCGRRARAGPG